MGRVGLCLVGLGRVAQNHLQAIVQLSDLFDLRAVVTRDRTKGDQARQQFQVGKVYGSLEESFEDPGIDAYDLCLPHHLHAESAIAAARSGRHVLVEKPLARDREEAEKVVLAAAASKVSLMVGQSRRFTRATLESKELIDNGVLGDVYSITGTVLGYMARPAVDWWVSAEKTGGLLLPLWGAHLIDYILWIYRKKPKSVYCQMGCLNPEKWEGEDEVHALFSFDSGQVACVQMSWNARLKPDGDTGGDTKRIWSSKGSRYERIVVGKKGTIILQDDEELFLNGERKLEAEGAPSNFYLELREFGRSILEGRESHASGNEILKVMEAMDACRRSAETHEVIHLS